MGKNVAVFVDVANIFYAAKAAGVDIDYVTLLRAATAGRDFVRAYAYTGLDPDNENQRNFHQFLARHSYKVVSKDIRKYGDGKVKANLDIELVVDLMKTARNLDIAVIVSGDGDFASAIRAVQEMGVRCEVISFRGNTSSDLIDVADQFTDITQIAKVDKSSTRSGRRVADDDEDLSMTEVPEKQSEGTGRGRGRGGRGRGRDEAGTSSRGGRGRDRDRDRDREVVAAPVSGGGQLVALPGEKLSRAAAVASVADGDAEIEEFDDELVAVEGGEPGEEGDGEGRRRRRRRGGRGRGRGRREGLEGSEPATDEEAEALADAIAATEPDDEEEPEAAQPVARTERGRGRSDASRTPSGELPTPFDDMDALAAAPRAPRSTPFGSVWDRQLGTTASRPAADRTPLPDEEDLEEPEVPEYLLAERRRGQGAQGGQGGRGGRGGRGGARSAYAAAIERERYGGSRGTGTSRYAEPTRGGQGGRSGGGGGRGGQQPARGGRQDRYESTPRPASGEEWSEVPPELEELLRAQLQRSQPAPSRAAAATEAAAQAEASGAEAPKRRITRSTAKAAAPAAEAEAPVAESAQASPTEAPKRRTTRKASTAEPAAEAIAEAPAEAAPKRRTTRKPSTAESAAEAPAGTAAADAPATAPKRRTTTRKAATAEPAVDPVAEAPATAPKRPTTRKAAEPTEG